MKLLYHLPRLSAPNLNRTFNFSVSKFLKTADFKIEKNELLLCSHFREFNDLRTGDGSLLMHLMDNTLTWDSYSTRSPFCLAFLSLIVIDFNFFCSCTAFTYIT